MARKYCDAILEVIEVMDAGLRAPLAGITVEHLNHSFAAHKMTLGQIAVHTMSWPRYFMSATPPWEKTQWTCRPCSYPLTPEFVDTVIADGRAAMREKLLAIDDAGLEATPTGEKGPGYILCRLQLHTMVHANQMSYLRHVLCPDWRFGGHFGNMATAYIRLPYHTDRDKKIGGF